MRMSKEVSVLPVPVPAPELTVAEQYGYTFGGTCQYQDTTTGVISELSYYQDAAGNCVDEHGSILPELMTNIAAPFAAASEPTWQPGEAHMFEVAPGFIQFAGQARVDSNIGRGVSAIMAGRPADVPYDPYTNTASGSQSHRTRRQSSATQSDDYYEAPQSDGSNSERTAQTRPHSDKNQDNVTQTERRRRHRLKTALIAVIFPYILPSAAYTTWTAYKGDVENGFDWSNEFNDWHHPDVLAWVVTKEGFKALF